MSKIKIISASSPNQPRITLDDELYQLLSDLQTGSVQQVANILYNRSKVTLTELEAFIAEEGLTTDPDAIALLTEFNKVVQRQKITTKSKRSSTLVAEPPLKFIVDKIDTSRPGRPHSVLNTQTAISNKAQLIDKVALDAGITKIQANAVLNSFVEAVMKTLKGNGKVTLAGFGTFSVTKRAARNGRNPQTGAVIKIKAKKVAKFRPANELAKKL